jgi:hypothetical protein
MAIIENKGQQPSGLEKKGGYSGGKPASSVPPPPKTPSATIRPAHTSKAKD